MELPPPRSLRSADKSYVRFINHTERSVEIVWINFNGQYIKYRVLEKGNFVDVNTFKTHPWIALDCVTKDRLHIENSFVYIPRTTKEFFQERHPKVKLPDDYEVRIRVKITLPVYSLKYRTLLEVRNFCRKEDDVEGLNLPKSLENDLKRLLVQRDQFQTIALYS